MGQLTQLKAASNVKGKSTPLVIKGTEYHLKFTLNAMAELEDKFGSVETAFAEMEKGKFKAIRAVLWAGLLEDHPEYTEKQVGSMIDLEDMVALTKALGDAGESDMPSVADVETVPN